MIAAGLTVRVDTRFDSSGLQRVMQIVREFWHDHGIIVVASLASRIEDRDALFAPQTQTDVLQKLPVA